MKDRYPKGQFADRVALLLGQSLQRSNDPQKAIAQYRAVLKQAGGEGQADALFGLATLLHQQKKADEAAGLLDQLIEKYPQNKLMGPALLLRGRISFEAQKYDEALATFQQAAKVDGAPRDETAYWLAKCELRRGQFAEAAARLADALRDSPKSALAAEMTYDRGVALMRAGDSPNALEALKGFSAKFPEHALAADALYLQAMIEHEQRQFTPSREHCKAFLAKYGGHTLASSVAFLAAENDFLDEHLPEAISGYQRFLQDFPKDSQVPKAKFRLGSALYRQQDFDAARLPLAQVVKGRNTPEEFRRGLLMLGDIAFSQEKWPEATQLMLDYLSFGADQPGADDALLKLGLAQTRQNKNNEALACFKSLIDQFPQSVHHTQALFETGQILLANKDLSAASNAFSSVLTDSKDDRFAPFALNHLASIAMQQQDFAKAAELFEQVAQKAAGTDLEPEAVFQRGQALMATKQFKPAGDAFALLVQKFPQFARIPQAQAQRAIALARQGEEVDALKAIELVQRDYGSKLAPDLLAGVMYEKAWCLRELGRNEEAATAYRDLLAAHDKQPVSAHALLELAEIEAAVGHHKESAELLTRLRAFGNEKALDVSADVKEPALYRLAVCRFELGQHQDAANLCEELIRDFPQSQFLASAHQFCGEALFKLDKPQQAGEHFKIVVEKFPADPAFAPSLLRLGECQAATDHFDQSEQTFVDYLKRFADSELWFQAQFGLGWARENQRRFDEAMADYKKVIEKHGGATAARAQFQIGECLFAQKKFEDAVRELLKVDILYGYEEWSAAALYEAGRCFEELTKTTEARTQFEQVQQRFPQSRWAKLAAQRLAAIAGRPVSGG
jgi:TolA-binding protein